MNIKVIKKVGVFFGSRSPEHDVSIITAQLVMSTLKKLDIDFVPILITKKGDFKSSDQFASVDFFKKNLDEQNRIIESLPSLSIKLEAISREKLISSGLSMTSKQGFWFFGRNQEIVIDFAFPCIHGSYGEDGTIQGLFELLSIPYVGCNVKASSIAMNKITTKYLLLGNKIRTPDFVTITKHIFLNETRRKELIQEIENKLKYPVFVKPANLGSSIGISKCGDRDSLLQGIESGLFYDNEILVEKAVPNIKDLTICIIGNKGDLRVSLIQETKYKSDLLDFNEKYLNGGGAQTGSNKSALIIPSLLDKVTEKNIVETARRTYLALGCTGIARVDILLDTRTNDYFVSEVNTMPGTIYSHLWNKTGLKTTELVKKLLEYGLEEYDSKSNLNYTFKSDILSTLGNSKKLSNELSKKLS